MTLNEYIQNLQDYLARHPEHKDTEVFMTQSGYYSYGNKADLYEEPEVSYNGLSLGHSHQSH